MAVSRMMDFTMKELRDKFIAHFDGYEEGTSTIGISDNATIVANITVKDYNGIIVRERWSYIIGKLRLMAILENGKITNIVHYTNNGAIISNNPDKYYIPLCDLLLN